MRGILCMIGLSAALVAFQSGCRQGAGGSGGSDTVVAKADATVRYDDSTSALFARRVLGLMRSKDYQALAEHIHPDEGLLFAPYGHIDTSDNRRFSRASFLALVSDSAKAPLNWGKYDGSGLPIELTWAQYESKFVYSADFLNAPQFSVNNLNSRGNSVNNIDAVFTGHQYTESFFPGFEEKYAGLDWASLRLVFKEKDGKLYLVGVVHDQWTS